MGQYHPPDFKLSTIGGEQRIIEMKVELGAFIVGAFAQKQVGAVAELDQLVVPSGVAGKDDRLSVNADSKRKRNVGFGMRTANRADLEFSETRRAAGLEHDELQLVFYFVEFEMREHRAHQLPGPLLQLCRSGNRKHLLAAAYAIIINRTAQTRERGRREREEEKKIRMWNPPWVSRFLGCPHK